MSAAVHPGIRAYNEVQAMPGRATSASFAISALVNVSGDHVTPEEFYGLIAELARIGVDLEGDRTLKGVGDVIELLDKAHTAALEITQALHQCSACSGSGEGRHTGRCLVCGGKGEVMA